MFAMIPRGHCPDRELELVPQAGSPKTLELALDRAFTLAEVADKLGIGWNESLPDHELQNAPNRCYISPISDPN